MNSRHLVRRAVGVACGCALMLALVWLIGSRQLAADNDAEGASSALLPGPVQLAFRNGFTVLTLATAYQERSGIQSRALEIATVSTGAVVSGTVVDLQPLVETYAQHAAAAAELKAAEVALAASRADLDRVQALYRDAQNVSLKTLEAAQAATAAASAKRISAAATLNAKVGAIRQQYGARMADWAALPSHSVLLALLTGRASLVRVVMSAQVRPPPLLRLIGDDQAPVAAALLWDAPAVDPVLPGRAYFYRLAAPLAFGTRLSGQLPGNHGAGVLVPETAVVWFGGQPWVYIQVDSTHFERRTVEAGSARLGNLIATSGINAGERVVVRGAQLLLSEENRALMTKD